MDVVEVLRGTAASSLLVAASVAGIFAAVATVLAVAAWWAVPRTSPGRRSSRWLLEVAFATSTLELTLLLLDGASLTGRWTVVAVVRLLLLAGMGLLATPADDGHADEAAASNAAATRGVGVALSVALLATSVLGAPTATGALPAGPSGLAIATGLALALVVATLAMLRWAAPRGTTVVLAGPLVLLLVVAAPAALATAPDRIPPHQQAQLTVDGLTLDVTVAPVQPGTNELHVYAFGSDGRPAQLAEVIVEVVGEPDSRHQLFPVSPDHHLSYVLELPTGTAWEIQLALVDTNGRALEVRWPVATPG